MKALPFVLLVVLAPPMAGSAAAQRNNCASCHVAEAGPERNPEYAPYTQLTAFARMHESNWEHSPHGRNGVGCEACHGGNPTTFERFEAHQGVLNSNNPGSRVHRSNLPQTCGRCHPGQFVAFQQSRHFELLQQGDPRGPVCTTCHEAVAARVLSPGGLERQCAECHGPGGRAPRPGRAEDVRLLLETVADVRASLDAARHLLDNVRDGDRRQALEDAYEQAEVPIIQAVRSAHQFVFDALRERLDVARERTAALLDRLANPR